MVQKILVEMLRGARKEARSGDVSIGIKEIVVKERV